LESSFYGKLPRYFIIEYRDIEYKDAVQIADIYLPGRSIGIIIPLAEDTKKCYGIHRQWRSPYSFVWCGNLTIPYYGRFFHGFFICCERKNCATARAGHHAAILFNMVILSDNNQKRTVLKQ